MVNCLDGARLTFKFQILGILDEVNLGPNSADPRTVHAAHPVRA